MKYQVGDRVYSVGGNFTEGVVLEVEDYDDTEQDLTIHWVMSVKGKINCMQKRSSDTVGKL